MVLDAGGTEKLITFKTMRPVPKEQPARPTPVVRIVLGAAVALVLAVAALGTTVPPDPDVVAPALVATVAAAPPVSLEAPVAPMVEPPVLTPSVPTVVATRKPRVCR
jgi:hypothetical protein